MPYGVSIYGAYTIALQDNSAFWLCNDLTVRRREGQIPTRISNPGIEAILQQANQANQLAGAYALTPTWHGHPMYVLTIPQAMRTLCYDCVTQQWFELSSIVSSQQVQWRALSWYNGFGLQLIGDSLTGQIGFLDPTTELEFGVGNPVGVVITLQPLYQQNKRVTLWRTEAVLTAGQGFVPGVAPKVTLNLSDNWGATFYTAGSEDQTLGVPGDTDNRSQWFVLGQHRSVVQQLVVTDSSPLFAVGVTSDYDLDDS
jgi:hypothetical protein